MAELGYDIDGLKKLKRALRQFPERIQKKVVKSAIRAGGTEVVKASRKELKKARYNYSTLSASIGQKILPVRRFGVTTIIGPRTSFTAKRKGESVTIDGWYAHIVEYGTLGSRTEPLSARTKRKHKYNPMPRGLPAQPFLRPGFEKSKRKALDKVGKKMWEAIRREARKLR